MTGILLMRIENYARYAGEKMVSIAYPLAAGNWSEAAFQILRCGQIIDGAAEVLKGW